ncbi:PDZ domain-containing protein [Lentibacillus persicus]|uniref:endopeptidase La n=1 Tax=Lentibacillus persicus TaxID=640948 RepID=A0A1I1VIF7_9BACI|nr:SepM family pheromone-processing serine protease [Lentibacillus persicus]SFD82832.1 PDZ domain-containing protein [Lentibacillus persicus]
MRFTKKHIIYLILVVAIALFISAYKLPFYVYKPGGADALNAIVEVAEGHQSEGDMHLVTIRGGQATPVQYIMAKVMPHQEIMPLREVRPEGVSEDEYFHAQLQMMESSQEASTVVAYEAAGEDITIDYKGVYVVSVIDGMPADGVLQTGDRITAIDGNEIDESNDLIDYVDNKQAGDTITVKVEREQEVIEKRIQLKAFPDMDERAGVGIQLVTDRNVEVDPEVNFSSGSIGGPSAGLMFSLEIYDQLTEEDLTKGYEIAGTGEVDYQGNVHQIGGVDKKVIAADREGCDVFFASDNKEAEDSNYENAVKTAEEIGTDMKIVPVNTFQDALDYLQNLEPAQT